MRVQRQAYSLFVRLHDLWILLAWAGILTGIFLNTFYNRSCSEFISVRNPTAPCQSFLDLGLVFLAAIGAGISISDERIAALGFLIVHISASAFFVVALVMPSLLGLTDTGVFSLILSRAVVLALDYQFPFAIFFSFIGSVFGLYLGGKLPGPRA